MAIYAQFDEDGACIQLATNIGWGQFGTWVESLSGYTRISSLWGAGNSEDISGLREELVAALESNKPGNAEAEAIVEQVVYAIDAAGTAEILMVTNGIKNEPPDSADGDDPPPKKPEPKPKKKPDTT